MIDEFKGKYFFLSNFYPSQVMFEGLMYKNSEAAFQSAKTVDKALRKQFIDLDPSAAKKKGRALVLRSDWELVKDDIMYWCVRDKFVRNTDLGNRLLNTGNKQLVEGNTWNDIYWGVCRGIGSNMLGKILMVVREELKKSYWV